MRSDSNSTPDLVGVVVTLAIAGLVLFLGFHIVSGPLDERVTENRQHFERYCEERFGDEADVWVGGGQGAHAGLHCSNDAGATVHLSAVDGATWQRYKNGQATAADVTESVKPIGPMGMTGNSWWDIIGVTIAIASVVLVISVVQRYRNKPTPE